MTDDKDIRTRCNEDSIRQWIADLGITGMGLSRDDREKRSQAYRAILECKDLAFPLLLSAFKNQPPNTITTNELAIELLGEIGETEAVETLINILETQGPHTRIAAAKALGKIGDPRAIAPLIESFRNKTIDPETDIEAAISAAHSLGQHGEAALEPLLNTLQDENSEVRGYTTIALGELGNPKAIEHLIELALHESNFVVRAHIANALGRIGDLSAVPCLADLLTDDAPYVRQCAVQALGRIEGPEVFEPVANALNDSSDLVKRAAIQVLGTLKENPRSFDLLLESTNDPDPRLRGPAALALGHLGDRRALPRLEQLLEDHSESISKSTVSRYAERAIDLILKQS